MIRISYVDIRVSSIAVALVVNKRVRSWTILETNLVSACHRTVAILNNVISLKD